MNKKILLAAIIAAMTVSAAPVFADETTEEKDNSVVAGTLLPESELENQGDIALINMDYDKDLFEKKETEVVKADKSGITLKGADDKEEKLETADKDIILNAAGDKKTAADIKEKDKLYIYSGQGIRIIIIMDGETSVDVDAYLKSEEENTLVNSKKDLQINIDKETKYVNVNGEEVKPENLETSVLVVFYGISTKSIPAQTTPDKIVVTDIKVKNIGGVKDTEEVKEEPEKVKKLVVNDKEVCDLSYDAEAKTFMIPVRAVAESLGYTVEWFGGELKVTVNNDESGVEFKIGENSYKAKDAESCKLEKQPELINDTTYVPSSVFSKLLGKTVAIDGENLTVK